MTASLPEKQQQFNAAMARYDADPAYAKFGRTVAVAAIALQALLGALALQRPVPLLTQLLSFAAAFVLADLVNGLVHLYMDRNDDYRSPAGPLVAAFHLHHRTPRYAVKPLPLVYFHETGAKVWLPFALLSCALAADTLPPAVVHGAFWFGVLSSVAEVAHYLCHVPDAPAFAGPLRRLGLLLDPRRHARHHAQDNVSYAFLNAMTDPLIDALARRLSPGYKGTTDLHYGTYAGPGAGSERF